VRHSVEPIRGHAAWQNSGFVGEPVKVWGADALKFGGHLG